MYEAGQFERPRVPWPHQIDDYTKGIANLPRLKFCAVALFRLLTVSDISIKCVIELLYMFMSYIWTISQNDDKRFTRVVREGEEASFVPF